eukprot:1189825-Prorocentrum_minimum.AAC.6
MFAASSANTALYYRIPKYLTPDPLTSIILTSGKEHFYLHGFLDPVTGPGQQDWYSWTVPPPAGWKPTNLFCQGYFPGWRSLHPLGITRRSTSEN